MYVRKVAKRGCRFTMHFILRLMCFGWRRLIFLYSWCVPDDVIEAGGSVVVALLAKSGSHASIVCGGALALKRGVTDVCEEVAVETRLVWGECLLVLNSRQGIAFDHTSSDKQGKQSYKECKSAKHWDLRITTKGHDQSNGCVRVYQDYKKKGKKYDRDKKIVTSCSLRCRLSVSRWSDCWSRFNNEFAHASE